MVIWTLSRGKAFIPSMTRKAFGGMELSPAFSLLSAGSLLLSSILAKYSLFNSMKSLYYNYKALRPKTNQSEDGSLGIAVVFPHLGAKSVIWRETPPYVGGITATPNEA
jgi:hypothetical protein